MMRVPSKPSPLSKQVARLGSFALMVVSSMANAQSMGQGVFTWVTPYILLVIAAGTVIGLAISFVDSQYLPKVFWGLVIAVAIFGVLHGMNSLLAAVQQG